MREIIIIFAYKLSHTPSVRGTLGVKVIVLEEDTPSVRGTLGVKVCVLGGDMPSVRGTLGVKVCVLGGDMPSVVYSHCTMKYWNSPMCYLISHIFLICKREGYVFHSKPNPSRTS